MKKTYTLERPQPQADYFHEVGLSSTCVSYLCERQLRNLWELPDDVKKIWITVSRTRFLGSVLTYFYLYRDHSLYVSHLPGTGVEVSRHSSPSYLSLSASGRLRESFPVSVKTGMRLWIKLEYEV